MPPRRHGVCVYKCMSGLQRITTYAPPKFASLPHCRPVFQLVSTRERQIHESSKHEMNTTR
uniref:Uncharacterized protein n=1 Tax=Arundo donax TaxID=35708 RepID=A0A0A9BIQ5_ARUDO